MRAIDAILPDEALDHIADALWARMVGANCDPVDLNLRAKLALETRLLGGGSRTPFGLDKLTCEETAAYIGVLAETLRDRSKRRALDIPQPYHIGRKLYWRRSDLDPWIEGRRERRFHDDSAREGSLPEPIAHEQKPIRHIRPCNGSSPNAPPFARRSTRLQHDD